MIQYICKNCKSKKISKLNDCYICEECGYIYTKEEIFKEVIDTLDKVAIDYKYKPDIDITDESYIDEKEDNKRIRNKKRYTTKNKKVFIISILLILILVVTTVAVTISLSILKPNDLDRVDKDGIYYRYDALADGYEIIGHDTKKEIIIVPETIRGKKVFKVSESAFNNSNMKKLYLGTNITIISKGALFASEKLEVLTIPFIGVNKEESSNSKVGLIFEKGNQQFDTNTFLPHSLTTLIILDKQSTIKYNAFEYCEHLRNIYLPHTISAINVYSKLDTANNTLINAYPFKNCYPALNIHIDVSKNYAFHWASYWNNYADNAKLNVIYNAKPDIKELYK